MRMDDFPQTCISMLPSIKAGKLGSLRTSAAEHPFFFFISGKGEMAALERPVAVPCPGRAFEVRRGEFLPDGLVIDSPPLTIAAAMAAVTVMSGALALFVISSLAARHHHQGV